MAVPSPSVESASSAQPATTPERLSYEGVVAGTLGAVTVALWFFVIDLFQGRPLHTPVVFEIWTFPPKCAMLLTSSGGTSHGSHCCDVPLLSK